MRRTLPLVVLACVVGGLVGCSRQTDPASGAAAESQGPAPVQEEQPAPRPTSPQPAEPSTPEPAPARPGPGGTPDSPDAATLPAKFQGAYALNEQACGQRGHESRLVLSAGRIQFHESSGAIEQVDVRGDVVSVNATVTGEGETRRVTYRFELSGDGTRLRDLDHGMVRVRCP